MRDDMRHSLRGLIRAPGFATALVASAAVGIGVTAVVFGFIGHLVDPAAMTGADPAGWQARVDTIRLLLVTVAVFVFIISAASVTGLMLSRAASRVHETSVRVALGAHGRTMIRPLLAEGLVVAVASAAFGLLAAFWTVNGLPAAFYAEDIESLPFSVDWRGVIIAALAGAVVVFAGALAPLAWTSRGRPAPDSRGTGPGLANTFGGWRSTLVVTQLTLCAALLISTGTVVDHLEAALRTDHAERTGDAVVVSLGPSGRRFYPSRMLAFIDALKERLGDQPMGLIQTLPGGDSGTSSYRIEGQRAHWTAVPALNTTFDGARLIRDGMSTERGRLFGGQDAAGSCASAVVNEAFATTHFNGDVVGRVIVSPEGTPVEVIGVMRHAAASRPPTGASQAPVQLWLYAPQGLRPEGHQAIERWSVPAASPRRTEALRANVIDGAHLELIGLSLVAGRSFDRRDAATACGVALLNEEAAAQLGADGVPGTAVVDAEGRRAEVVGVVREETFRTLQPRAVPTIYFSYRQRIPSSSHLVLSMQAAGSEAASRTAAALLGDVPGEQITGVTTLQEHLQKTSVPADRLVTTVVQVFAGLAVLLSLVGVTGVTMDAVARRTPEIALRIALGAPRWRIVSGVVAYGLRLAAAGATVGVIACLVAFRFVAPLPDGSRGPALWLWAAAPVVLIGMVIIGTLVPARRALAVDPSRLLRE